MAGTTKLLTSGGGGVSITPDASIASDITVKVPTSGVSGGTLVCSDFSGNVGIGTNAPATKIEALSSGANTVRSRSTSNNPMFELYADGYATAQFSIDRSSGVQIYGTGAIPILFSTNSTERMRIDSSGNLLLSGPSTVSFSNSPPAAQKDVRLVFGGAGSLGNSQASAFYWRRAYDNVDVAAVNGYGSFFSLSNSYGALSDPAYKENIEPARSYLEDLCKLKIVKYSLKIEKSNKPTQLGLLSTNVKDIFPSLVTYTNETNEEGKETGNVIEGVKYSVFVPMLIQAIQELKAELNATKAEVAALKGAA